LAAAGWNARRYSVEPQLFTITMDHTAVSNARLASYWEGPVTWVERLCVASMLHHGHELTIYTHDPQSLVGCNLGADVRDAREVVTEKDFVHRYRTVGRFNMFANLFRLELQRQSKGIWVDLDCYLVRPLVPQSEYVFGLSSRDKINNAVLRLPPDCPMIGDYMRAITADPLRLPWSSFRRRLWREIEILMGRSQPHALVRSNIGPRALTYFAKRHDILKHAMPREAFYPLAVGEAPILVNPDPSGVAAKVTAQTVLVHLWRGKMSPLGLVARLPPATSYLGAACARHGIIG
jgi:hypothetical protein